MERPQRVRASDRIPGAPGYMIEPRTALALIRQLGGREGLLRLPCQGPGCSKETPPLPAVLEGEPEALCLDCSAEAKTEREAKTAKLRVDRLKSAKYLASKLAHAGLDGEARTVEALRIEVDKPAGELRADGRYKKAAQTVLTYLASEQGQGTLILGGFNQTGKSVAAAFAAWSTGGRFLKRAVWRSIPFEDRKEIRYLAATPGVLVVDDALPVAKGGDPGDKGWPVEVVWQLVLERHQANRATIITTNAAKGEVGLAYGTKGDGIVERAEHAARDLAGEQAAGGFVWCGGAQGGRR